MIAPLDRACLGEGRNCHVHLLLGLQGSAGAAAVVQGTLHQCATDEQCGGFGVAVEERMVGEEELARDTYSLMHESQLVLTSAAFRGQCSPATVYCCCSTIAATKSTSLACPNTKAVRKAAVPCGEAHAGPGVQVGGCDSPIPITPPSAFMASINPSSPPVATPMSFDSTSPPSSKPQPGDFSSSAPSLLPLPLPLPLPCKVRGKEEQRGQHTAIQDVGHHEEHAPIVGSPLAKRPEWKDRLSTLINTLAYISTRSLSQNLIDAMKADERAPGRGPRSHRSAFPCGATA
uniref:Uncharacterized protein n=1 Tax=Oryza barthii TaxID=65489 RepID=A0A0D3GH72_9ORYZ